MPQRPNLLNRMFPSLAVPGTRARIMRNAAAWYDLVVATNGWLN